MIYFGCVSDSTRIRHKTNAVAVRLLGTMSNAAEGYGPMDTPATSYSYTLKRSGFCDYVGDPYYRSMWILNVFLGALDLITLKQAFNTSNTSGKARINNVLNINPTYQIDSAGGLKCLLLYNGSLSCWRKRRVENLPLAGCSRQLRQLSRSEGDASSTDRRLVHRGRAIWSLERDT